MPKPEEEPKPEEAAAVELVEAAFVSTELAVQPTAVERVTAALSDEEWDGVPDGHIGGTVTPRLPRVLLNRKSGQKESGFTDELTGEQFATSEFVWLGDTMTRAWWPEAFGKGDKSPSCRSADGVTPDPKSPDVQAETCAACPKSQWDGEESPECNASVEVMIFLLAQQRLSLVRFGGMSVSRVNKFLGALNAHVPRKPPLAYVTRVELEDVDTPNGTFLVPRFSVAGEIPRVEAGPLIALQKAKLDEWVEQLAVDLADGATREAAPTTATGDDPNEEPF